jgi:hypothetical protein
MTPSFIEKNLSMASKKSFLSANSTDVLSSSSPLIPKVVERTGTPNAAYSNTFIFVPLPENIGLIAKSTSSYISCFVSSVRGLLNNEAWANGEFECAIDEAGFGLDKFLDILVSFRPS